MKHSWKFLLPAHTESAIDAVRLVVAALRTRGLKSEHAIQTAAPSLGVSAKRVRTLFYRDGTPIVLADEWDALRVRAAAVLRREADKLRQKAAEYEAQADQLDRAQLSLWETNECQYGAGSRKVAA